MHATYKFNHLSVTDRAYMESGSHSPGVKREEAETEYMHICLNYFVSVQGLRRENFFPRRLLHNYY